MREHHDDLAVVRTVGALPEHPWRTVRELTGLPRFRADQARGRLVEAGILECRGGGFTLARR